MPWWSRSCCENPAWQPLPRSWRNLKPSREVFANQDFNQNSARQKKKKRSDVGTFQPTSFEVEWDLFTLSFPSLLESIHQRSDRRGGRWVAANSLTQTLKGLGLLKKTPLKLNPSVGSVSSSFMRKCDSENLLAESAVVALHWTQAVVYLFFSCFSFKEICLLTPCGRNQ